MGQAQVINSGTIGANSTGLPAGSGVSPLNVTDLTCSGIVNPNTLTMVLTVSFTPPTDGTYTGVTLWLLMNPPGANTIQNATGSTMVTSDSTAGSGISTPFPIGTFNDPTLPLTVTTLFPDVNGLNAQMATPCTLYCTSNSTVITQSVVSVTTPSVDFTLEPSTGTNPTAATNVTTDIVESLIVTEVGSQTVSGKMITGLLAEVTGIPSKVPANWNYILVGVQGANDPTVAANQQKLTGPETVEGPVPAPPNGDGFTGGQTSFVMQTPTASTAWTIYAVAGIGTKYNAIVPGITCSFPLTLDSGSSGVLSAIDLLQSTISSELSTATGKLGITPSSLTSSFLAPGSAVGNLANSSIIAPLLAAGVAQTNLGIVSAAAIISPATITGTLVANNTITGSLLATSGIITNSAQIDSAVIASASIISLGVSQLTAGTAQFSGTVVFQYSTTGPNVTIESTGLLLSGGAGSTGYVTIEPSGVIVNSGGSSYVDLSSTGILISGPSGQTMNLTGSSLTLNATSNDYLQITSGAITMKSGGATVFTASTAGASFASGATIGGTLFLPTGQISCSTSQGELVLLTASVTSNATGGSATALPSLPAGYMYISASGTLYKVALYNT